MENRIKVLAVNVGSKDFGGVSRYLFSILQNIDKRKIQMEFLTPFFSTYNSVKEDINNLGGKTFELRVDNKSKILKMYNIKKSLIDFIKQNQYDIVYINSGSIVLNYVISKTIKQNTNAKIIIHSHNGDKNNNIFKKLILNIFKKQLTKYADKMLACSDLAAKHMFCDMKECTIIPNGIEIDKFVFDKNAREEIRKKIKAEEDTMVIGHIGRFAKQKNHTFLIETFYRLHQKNKNSILLLIGQGTLKEKIKKQINNLNLKESVIILEQRKDVSKYYSAMDIFVFPSLYEGLPISLIEAQASALPIICSSNITRNVKTNENVFFLKINDATKWSNKILSTDIEEANRQRNDIQKIRDKYNIKEVTKKIESILLDMCNKEKTE